jgi:competence protein ComEC
MPFHAPLLPLAVSLVAGILLGEWFDDQLIALPLLAGLAVAACLLRHHPRMQTAAIGMGVVMVGVMLRVRANQQIAVEWPEGRQQVECVVISEPVVKEKFVAVDLLTTHGHRKLQGRIARDGRSERIIPGDGLVINAYINKVHAWQQGHFSYQRYMACHGFAGELYARSADWQQQELSLSGLTWVERARLRALQWRHRLLQRYRQWGIGDEAYGILAAMTLGEKSQVDAQLKETYSQVGASHILALSGLHLMIIYGVITLFVGWRRIRMASQLLIVLAIWGFAFLVGLAPSVVRAAFMISVYALLSLGHRERMSVNTLAFTAIVMLVVRPLAVYDMGFQLSFAAVLAILLFHPLFEGLLPADVLQRHRWLKLLWGLTAVSLSAQIGTAPLVAYYFERFATSFLLANYVVIPLATIILYLALATIAFCWWSSLQALLVTVLSSSVLLMNHLLARIAQLPCNSIDGIHLSTVGLVLVYVIIASGYVLLTRLRRA